MIIKFQRIIIYRDSVLLNLPQHFAYFVSNNSEFLITYILIDNLIKNQHLNYQIDSRKTGKLSSRTDIFNQKITLFFF